MKREHVYKLRDMMHKAAASLSDTDAQDGVELFPVWAAERLCKVDERLRYGGKLYKVLQTHTSQADWTPDKAVSLYAEVERPGEGDSPDNPIAYSGNMALIAGKYYSQDGVVYRCFRDTINPVYNALADLVGLYVEVAE